MINSISSIGDVDLFFYSSKAGNTSRLARKLNSTGRTVNLRETPEETTSGPWVLIVPTYMNGQRTSSMPPQVIRFLRNNPTDKLLGVIGTGNRNFGSDFCVAADRVSEKFRVPVLGRIEYSGTPSEIDLLVTTINTLKGEIKS